ncbi:hypothetical protein DFQ00_105109 [Paenibacillus barcinonensis]|uniref:Uncharacterized protein n=1 Tax=Paenibacillus barcinonensis TaxID=198119 RepID=A0A2V4V9N1_PAEBA|nr:hypothetical protein DFQ00_105109 [Paenibacillus barcinonensis]
MMLGYDLNSAHRNLNTTAYPAHRLFGLIRST